MTRPRQAPASSPGDAELRDALEKNGLRLTRQRAAVYHFLRADVSHPTAEAVFEAVQGQIGNISLATVYNALDVLVAAGLVRRVTALDGPCRFDARREAHYHLVCQDTGQILDLPVPFDPDLVDKLDPSLVERLRRQGFQVTGYRLELLGEARTG